MLEPNDYDPVADLYDIYVPATFDIPFFLGETARSRGDVLELMSGTGRVSVPLLEAGVKLTCVDLSPEMLAILKEKLARRGLAAELIQADVCKLDLAKCFDLIIIPFHSFAEVVSVDDRRQALSRVRQHLTPDGRLICTMSNPKLRGKSIDGTLRLRQKYALSDGRGTLLLWLLENYSAVDNHIVELSEFFEEYDQRGILKSKRLLALRYRLETKEEFRELAESAGMRVAALYGDYDHSEFHEDRSPYMIWELRKAV